MDGLVDAWPVNGVLGRQVTFVLKSLPAELPAPRSSGGPVREALLRGIAKDIGISDVCLLRQLKIIDRQDGGGRLTSPGQRPSTGC